METFQKKRHSLSSAEGISLAVCETKGTKPSPVKIKDECNRPPSEDDLSDSQDIRSHTDEKPFVCETCGKVFRDKSHLKGHMHVHNETYKCSYSGKSHVSPQKLRVRKPPYHTGERPYVRNHRGKGYANNPELTYHNKLHEEGDMEECSLCEMKFTTKRKLITHQLINILAKPYQFHSCEMKFITKRSLNQHRLIHQPHQCLSCKASFTTKGGLKYHEMIHADEKPQRCELCLKNFQCKVDLKIHLRTHTIERPYTCDVCKCSFLWFSGFKSHLTTHTKEELLRCDAGWLAQVFPAPGKYRGKNRYLPSWEKLGFSHMGKTRKY